MKTPLVSALVSALVAAALLPLGAAHAAAGDLDPSFGTGGRVSHAFAQSVVPADVALQPDGKILVATGFNNTRFATEAFGLVRLMPDGSLDASFGQAGVAMTAFTNFINAPRAMALLPDGRIVLVGNAQSADGTLSEFAIARFNPDGTLDAGFGRKGRVTTNFVGVQPGGVSNPAIAVLALPGGKLLVAGQASQCAHCVHNTALARYLPDGQLDPAFGTGGLVTVPALGPPNALALLSNGHLLALSEGAIAEFTGQGDWVTVVSTTAGASLVAASHTGTSTFGRRGRFADAHGAQGPLGRNDIDVQVTAFEPLGNANVSFASPVFDFADPPQPLGEAAQAIALQPDGRLVVAGLAAPALGVTSFGLARLAPDGPLDAGFGNGGTLTTSFDEVPDMSFSFVNALALQPDGRILAMGLTGTHSGTTLLSLARYLGR